MSHTPDPSNSVPSRGDLTAQMRSMIAVAERGNRDFTPTERKAFDALKAKRDATPLVLMSKAELEAVLQAAGLPKNAAKAVAAGGWSALAGEQDNQQLAANLAARVNKFTQSIRRKS